MSTTTHMNVLPLGAIRIYIKYIKFGQCQVTVQIQ